MPSANELAEALQSKAPDRANRDAQQIAQFRQDTLARLRAHAQSRRKAAASKDATEAARKAEATNAQMTQRAPKPMVDVSDRTAAAAPMAMAGPSQLDLMRIGLSEQALGARDLMLARCELPMASSVAESVDKPVDSAAADAAMAHASAGGTLSARRAQTTASTKSMLRDVTSAAALADRLGAREARSKKQAEARRALQRAQLAEAVMAEREAAERAEALRCEVIALEEAAQLKEEEAAAASVQAAEHERHMKVIESERFFDALREELRQEAARAKRPLPPLCSCGLSPLENHTINCARNCIFFDNPQVS